MFKLNLSMCIFLVSMMSLCVMGSGPDDEAEPYPTNGDEPYLDNAGSSEVSGSFYARVGSLNHVIVSEEGDLLLFMEVKVFPAFKPGVFPTIEQNGIQSEMNIAALVEVDDVYVPRPSMMDNRNRSHFRVENETSRFEQSIGQVKDIVSMSETFILSDIKVDKENRRFVADVAYRMGGVDRDLYTTLYADGFIASKLEIVDFGGRRP